MSQHPHTQFPLTGAIYQLASHVLNGCNLNQWQASTNTLRTEMDALKASLHTKELEEFSGEFARRLIQDGGWELQFFPDYMRDENGTWNFTVDDAAALLGGNVGEVGDKLRQLLDRQKKLERELDALKAKAASGGDDSLERAALEDELGDLFFSLVNVARKHRVDPAIAMHRALEKFSRRFRHVEKAMAAAGETMEPGKLALMDRYWDEAKRA